MTAQGKRLSQGRAPRETRAAGSQPGEPADGSGRAPARTGQQRPCPSSHQGPRSTGERALDDHPPRGHLAQGRPPDPQTEGRAAARSPENARIPPHIQRLINPPCPPARALEPCPGASLQQTKRADCDFTTPNLCASHVFSCKSRQKAGEAVTLSGMNSQSQEP